MNSNKIIGYILLAVGLLFIILPLYQAFNIYIGKSQPPEIFKNFKLAQQKNVSSTDIQKQMEIAFTNVIPIESIHKAINLTAWMIIVLVFIFAGTQIASIGIKMLKD